MNKKELRPCPDAVRTVLAYDEDYTVTKMCCQPGLGPAPHSHPHKQVIYVLSGSGEFMLGEEPIQLSGGKCVSIPGNVPHTFRVVEEEITWLEFFTPGREDLKP